MKVALIAPWSVTENSVGGTERFTIDLAEGLSKIGHKVDVYTFSGTNQTVNNVNYISIDLLGDNKIANEYDLIKKFGDFSIKSTYEDLAKEIERLINVQSYDIIHINTQLLLKAWKGHRRVFTVHTNPFEFELDWGLQAYRMMINVMTEENIDNQTTFVVPSMYYSEKFKKLTNGDFIFIPHAIDPTRLTINRNRKLLLKRYKLDDKINILIPSRLEPVQKQTYLTFEAVALMNDLLKKKIQIISSGLDEQYKVHRSELEGFSLKNNISAKFLKFETMGDAYSLADIVVLTSRSESFGYSALESLSLGLPTVLNNIQTFKEISENNLFAHFFNGTEQELATILTELILNKEKINEVDKNWIAKFELIGWARKYEVVFKSEK